MLHGELEEGNALFQRCYPLLADGEEAGKAKAVCSNCGGELKEDGECSVCGARHDPKGEGGAPKDPREALLDEVSSIPGLGPAKAEALVASGYHSISDLRKASQEDLAAIEGFGEKLAEKVYEHFQASKVPPEPAEAATVNDTGKEALEKWLKGEEANFESWLDPQHEQTPEAVATQSGGEGAVARQPPAEDEERSPAVRLGAESREGSMESLRRWLKGDETALEDWLSEPGAVSREVGPSSEGADDHADEDVGVLRAELAELRRALKSKVDEEDGFNPVRYLEQIAKLNQEIRQEVKRRKEMESELDHIKKSSVAVIKYVKTQKGEEAPEAQRRLAEEREARKRLEIELGKVQTLLDQAKQELNAGLMGLPEDQRNLKEAELRLKEKETELKAREEQLRVGEEELAAESAKVADAELEHRLQAELAEKEREFLDKEASMQKKVIELEGEIDRLKIDAKLRAEAIELTTLPQDAANKEIASKVKEFQAKEKELLLREEEMQKLREELAFKDQEIEKLKEPLAYKEEEMMRREEDLIYREKLLEAEKRRLEEAKAKAGSVEEVALKERLESLKAEISKKEEEVRAKEKYLSSKMEELRLREQGLIEDEIDAREEERKLEMRQEKVKTGTTRLDDLLLGGVPFGSNVSIYGPPFIGKEVIVSAFIAEGLKKGVPALWVITDKTPEDIREEMEYVLPGYSEYERLGLVRYVDAYSKGMGAGDVDDPNVIYVDDPTDHDAILEAVDAISKELKVKHSYYRLAFRSISTLIAYLDPATAFRFLQPFAGRRKRDKAISTYLIEKGMHGEQEIQLLGSVMDGMIEFKVEQLKTFLSVKGICDVQSRAWIQYMYSKQGVSIGSFSLDHIK